MNKKTSKKKGGIKRLIKWIFIIAFILALLLTVMASLGGKSDELKGVIQDVLSESTGYEARIGKLNHASLFPNLGFDFEYVAFFKSADEEGNVQGDPLITLEKGRLYFSFWDVLLSSGKIKALEIKKFYAAPGVYSPKALAVRNLAIYDLKDGGARLEGDGYIGKVPASIKMDMDKEGAGAARKYVFGGKRHMEFSFGDVSLSAMQEVDTGFIFRDVVLALKEQPVIQGHFTVQKQLNGLNLKGRLDLLEHKTRFNPDLDIIRTSKHWSVSGFIKSPELYLEDFSTESSLRQVLATLSDLAATQDHKEQEERTLSRKMGFIDLDLALDLNKIYIANAPFASFKGDVTLKDSHLAIKSRQASISKGKLDLDFNLDARAQEATLIFDTTVHGLDYGQIQSDLLGYIEINGTLDAALNLEGSGRTQEELIQSLSGKATLVSGEGIFGSGKFNLWGGGLINALMPDFDQESETLKMNCAIMDFSIEQGLATANTLFIDGAHVTIAGQGEYDLVKDELDLKLTPKSKSISLGDISTPVRIRGSITDPAIGADMLDIGARIGGLLLGAVNPAFLAFTLTDLGLSEKHPCARYMDSKNTAPKEEQDTQLKEKREVNE